METSLTTEQLERLPKYARQEINWLLHNANYYKKRALQSAGEVETRITLGPYGHKVPLPELPISFALGENEKVIVRHAPGREGVVEVMVCGVGDTSIEPLSSNVFWLRCIKRPPLHQAT